MKASEDRINSTERSSLHPLTWLGGLVLVAIAARVVAQWNVPVPKCGFRSLTSWPCPLCGGTRAFRELSEGDLLAAAQFNPMVFIGTFLILGWIAISLSDRLRRTSVVPELRSRLERWPIVWIASGLVLTNWIYLILFLR